MNVTMRVLGLARSLYSFAPLAKTAFTFSQYFEKADEQELSDAYKKHYRKEYLHYKLTDHWKKPLEKKQRRKQRKIEIASSKDEVKDQEGKLVVHNTAVGINYPVKLEEMFAVVQVDGFQYKVFQDALIILDTKKDHAINQKIIFDKVPLVGTKTFTLLGRPNIQNAYVQAIVESISDSKKVIVFKKQRRKNYKRSFGSRISLTQCRIKNIVYQLTDQILNKAIELQ